MLKQRKSIVGLDIGTSSIKAIATPVGMKPGPGWCMFPSG